MDDRLDEEADYEDSGSECESEEEREKNDDLLEIVVKRSGGENGCLTIHVDGGICVHDLKLQIADALVGTSDFVPVTRQRLIFAGRMLKDPQSLVVDLRMKPGAVNYIHLCPLPEGAVPSKRDEQGVDVDDGEEEDELDDEDDDDDEDDEDEEEEHMRLDWARLRHSPQPGSHRPGAASRERRRRRRYAPYAMPFPSTEYLLNLAPAVAILPPPPPLYQTAAQRVLESAQPPLAAAVESLMQGQGMPRVACPADPLAPLRPGMIPPSFLQAAPLVSALRLAPAPLPHHQPVSAVSPLELEILRLRSELVASIPQLHDRLAQLSQVDSFRNADLRETVGVLDRVSRDARALSSSLLLSASTARDDSAPPNFAHSLSETLFGAGIARRF